MKKVIVIGCPGSGKSTFSRALQSKTGIPLFYLDMMYWNPDKTKTDKAIFLARLASVLQKDEWIIDGNYGSTMEARLQACDTAFFLDYPVDVCLNGIRERRGRERPDMPWYETDEEDPEFLAFIKDFHAQSRPAIMELLNKYSDKNVIVFSDRKEADDYLTNLQR
jgi:hypothetical protein